MGARRVWVSVLVLAVPVLGLAPPAWAIPRFIPLGNLGGVGVSRAFGISADGTTVVGETSHASHVGVVPFVWTEADGMSDLGNLPGGMFTGRASAASADGSVVVGELRVNGPGTLYEAFRWTASGGMVGLGDLPGGKTDSRARDVSADGEVVVGQSHTDPVFHEAFVWTAAEGMQSIGPAPEPYETYGTSVATAVSPDGLEVGGRLWAPGNAEPFRWSDDLPITAMSGDGLATNTRVSAIHRDDQGVVHAVGTGWGGAMRWTGTGGPTGYTQLGDLPGGGLTSEATDMSADREVVVGWGSGVSGQEAALFHPDGTLVTPLRQLLEDEQGLDLTGWTLSTVEAVSDDGRVFAGTGENPFGAEEAWIAFTEPGFVQGDPFLPDPENTIPGTSFAFTDAPTGRWFDPPITDRYRYEMIGEERFTAILGFPTGFDGDFTVKVGGVVLGEFAAGDSVDFVALLGSGVSEFTIEGITPGVDTEDATAFPLQLDFDAPTASFTMTPAPPTAWLALAVAAGLHRIRRRGGCGRNQAVP